VQPNVARKLAVVRATLHDKGKGVQDSTTNEAEYGQDNSDSDYDDVHEADSGDSSADDEEAMCYRKHAQELKERVRKKMLGEEHPKETKVPEEFIVPESIAEEEESDCFDSEDELSFE
jgi:hypothetical protein